MNEQKTELYHTKNYQGTTTHTRYRNMNFSLYHTKNYQGTTTPGRAAGVQHILYHTKNYQGTTTVDLIDAGAVLFTRELQFFCCMFPILPLLFRFFFSVKTSHKSFQQKCAEVREGVYPVLMPDIVL